MDISRQLSMQLLIYEVGSSYLPQSRTYRVMITPRSRTLGQVFSLGSFINLRSVGGRVLTLGQSRALVEFSCDSRGPRNGERRAVQDGRIVNCACMERTEYGLSNAGRWKHADGLILMEVAFRPSVTGFNVWHHRVDYWGPTCRQSVLCNPCSSRGQISLVPVVPEGAAHRERGRL